MNRVVVALLSAVDAVVAAAIGLGAVLVPLTLLWIFAFDGLDWVSLWPAAARIWELGNLVPLHLTLPDELLRTVGLPPEAGVFAVSLAPLAFTGFVLFFAARSGRRAARAQAPVTGAVGGVAVTLAIAIIVLMTSGNEVAEVASWQAVLFPTLVYAAGVVGGAFVTAWIEGDDGLVDALHDRVDALPALWRAMPALMARGSAVAVVGLIGLGGVAILISVLTRGGEMIALFEAAQVDALGATALTAGHLAYLPTALVWAISWIAGPGFAVGTATAVSPGATNLGVVPGLPMLGLLPDHSSPWMLLVALLPVALGALAGVVMRVRLVQEWTAEGILEDGTDPEPYLPRIALAVGTAVLTATAMALLAVMASGAIGPGRLADTGPAAGPVALAVGLEILVGAGIVMVGPRVRERS